MGGLDTGRRNESNLELIYICASNCTESVNGVFNGSNVLKCANEDVRVRSRSNAVNPMKHKRRFKDLVSHIDSRAESNERQCIAQCTESVAREDLCLV